MDRRAFDRIMKENAEELEKYRRAQVDNFEQLLATDNYLEKYLPFRIQNMISSRLNCFIHCIPNLELKLSDKDKVTMN